jgi:hypothetical protein
LQAISGDIDRDYYGSLVITLLLALLVACGDVIIVVFLGLTELPVIIRTTDETIQNFNYLEDKAYDPSAFISWGVIFTFNIM